MASGRRLLLLLEQDITEPPILHNSRITEDGITRITENDEIRIIEGTLLFALAEKMLINELQLI